MRHTSLGYFEYAGASLTLDVTGTDDRDATRRKRGQAKMLDRARVLSTEQRQVNGLGIADALQCSADQAADQRPISLMWTSDGWNVLKEQFGCRDIGVAIIIDAYKEKTCLDRPISYSRDRSHYGSIPKRYRSNFYQYRSVVSEIDKLAESDLIYHDRALPGRWGWRSSFRATERLAERVHDVLHGNSIELRHPREPIVLRDVNGDLLDYRDTERIRRVRKHVHSFNEAMMATDVRDIYGNDRQAVLTRIYNQSFNRGGRLYAIGGANWQNFKTKDKNTGEKYLRSEYLLIDDEPVEEVDFKALHPMLLYANEGEKPPEDPYDFGWPGEYRDLIKLGLLVMINAQSEAAARCAIAYDDHEMPRFAVRGSSQAFNLAKKLIKKAREVHRPIARHFNSDAGGWLMNKDSRISVVVMKRLLKQNIVVLPVHDSFVVPATKVERLEDAMVEAAGEHGLKAAKIERKDRSGQHSVPEHKRHSKPAPNFPSSPCPARTFYTDLTEERRPKRDLDEDITPEAALRARGQMKWHEE